MTRQIASVAAPRYLSCDILCIRSENIQRANTQNWIPLRLIDTHPYPKTGVLLQGRKTPTLGTANPHSIYPVHTSIQAPNGWAGTDRKSLGGKDAPWLATLFAELRAGAFGELDLGKLVLHGWSGGAHMVSWLIELLYSGAVKYDGVQLAGGVPAG